MRKSLMLAAVPVALGVIMSARGAPALCLVGGRFFPAALGVAAPCVADEMSLPTVSGFKTGDDPPARQLDVSVEYSKRITESFGVSIASTWTHLRPPGMPSASGFQNAETTFKYQFLTVPEHEFVMSAALAVEWGNSGAAGVGAESFTTYTPTIYIGKGFGDLPDTLSWLRPIGVTAQVGYAIPSSSAAISIDPAAPGPLIDNHPRFLRYGGPLQNNKPFLKPPVGHLPPP